METKWRSWLSLERAIDIQPADLSEAELLSYVRASRKLMADNGTTIVLMLVAGALVFWPFDLIVFRDRPQVIAIFAEWRLTSVAFLLVGLFVVRRTGLLERSPEAVARFIAVVGFGMTGWFMGRLGGLDEPWFTFLTATPMFTVLILLSLRARFILNFAIMGAAWLGYVAARPESLSHPSHGTIMTQYVFNCLFGIASGHITYMVLRANSAASARLASSRAELERFTVRLESMVAERTEELRGVLRGAETVRDRERAWVVREIHDALGQELTALRYGIAVLRRQIGPGVAPNAFEPVEDLIGRAAGSVRRILGGLSSELPEHVPLPEALEHMVREVGDRAGLDVRFELRPATFGRVDLRLRQTVFRIAQEATTNVLRHAGARTLSVRLTRSSDSLRLEIEDDGVGLERSSRAGIGMAGIRHRAAECGGTASWSAGSSGGTLLAVEVPCPT